MVGLANAQRNGLGHVQGTVSRSAGKDRYLYLYGRFPRLNCPLVWLLVWKQWKVGTERRERVFNILVAAMAVYLILTIPLSYC